MISIKEKTRVCAGRQPDTIGDEILSCRQPLLLKGLVADWPLVAEGLKSDRDADTYLRSFYNGKTVGTFFGTPDIAGRFFYNRDVTGFNYESRRVPLDEVLDNIDRCKEMGDPPAYYVGSTTVDACLPGLRAENDVDLSALDPLASIWVGNQSRIACHYDAPSNLACCAVGRRRFILFPPEQIKNLYPGPIDLTPAGQVISMVDFADPDFDAHPRFRAALDAAQVAELEPGDALFIPSMWWHHVEGLNPLNVLINYWWSATPGYMGAAVNVLNHALLSLRDLPDWEKQAWKHIFDYYIFGDPDRPREHIPGNAQGVLGEFDELKVRKLRALLLNSLNR